MMVLSAGAVTPWVEYVPSSQHVVRNDLADARVVTQCLTCISMAVGVSSYTRDGFDRWPLYLPLVC